MNQATSPIVPSFTILDGWAHDFSVEDTSAMTGATPDEVRAAYEKADAEMDADYQAQAELQSLEE